MRPLASGREQSIPGRAAPLSTVEGLNRAERKQGGEQGGKKGGGGADATGVADTTMPGPCRSGHRFFVDAGGLSPNTWERLERLSSAWEQAKRGLASQELAAPEQGPGVVLNPTRRSRTPLTPEEVDAIRTARSDGQSATAVAKRFEVHRGTVWTKTR